MTIELDQGPGITLAFIVSDTPPHPTSREEPISVLDDRLNDANNLKGQGGHHLCHVAETEKRGYSVNIMR